MLQRPNKEREIEYDYDNPSMQANGEGGFEEPDAGVVRPQLANLALTEEAAQQSTGAEDPAETGSQSKIKGLFGGKKKEKKEKKEKKPKKLKGTEDGGFVHAGDIPKDKKSSVGKLKGLFKKKGPGSSGEAVGQDTVPVVSHTSDEETKVSMDVANPAFEPSIPSPDSPSKQRVDPDQTFDAPSYYTPPLQPVQKGFSIKRFVAVPQRRQPEGPRLELRAIEPQSFWRCSTFLNFLLVLGAILGIIFLALSSDNRTLQIIGPCFLGLSIFALVGKIFFTLFWQEEPLGEMRYALQKGQIPLPKINLKPGSKVRRKAVYKVESEKKPVESYEIQMPEMKKPKKKSTKWSFLSRKKNTDRVKPEEEILPQELTQFPVEPGPSSFSYDEDIDTRIRSAEDYAVDETVGPVKPSFI